MEGCQKKLTGICSDIYNGKANYSSQEILDLSAGMTTNRYMKLEYCDALGECLEKDSD